MALDDLDGAFNLTPMVQSGPLRELYEVLVSRMRKEAEHLPMNTVQQLLIERIASNYVMLKARESLPIGDDQGFQHTTALKDFNTFWLKMTQEFNANLRSRAGATDHDVTLRKVRDIILSELGQVTDDEVRNHLMSRFTARFDAEQV